MGVIVAILLLIPVTIVATVINALWRGWLGMLVLGIAYSYQPEFPLFRPLGYWTCVLIALVVGMFVPSSVSTSKSD